MNEFIKKLKELDEVTHTDFTEVTECGVTRPATAQDHVELIRDEISHFVLWVYEWLGDRNELDK